MSVFDGQSIDLGHLTDEERRELGKMNAVRDGLAALKDVPECQLSKEQLHRAILGSMSDAQRTEHRNSLIVHQGLNALKDIPECQLGNERLRDAILGNAVRPRRVSGWSFATAGIAVLAIAAIAFRMNGSGGEAPVVKNDSPTSFGPSVDDNASLEMGNQSTVQVPPSQRSSRENLAGASQPMTKESGDLVADNSVGPDYHSTSDVFSIIVSNLDFGPSQGIVAVPDAATTSSHEPIVVVDPNSRTRNGAAKATEMDSYGDVVFGG